MQRQGNKRKSNRFNSILKFNTMAKAKFIIPTLKEGEKVVKKNSTHVAILSEDVINIYIKGMQLDDLNYKPEHLAKLLDNIPFPFTESIHFLINYIHVLVKID